MRHPYEGIGAYARWDRGVAAVPPAEIDPVVRFPVKITPEQRIVTAGSCFAQHISRYLRAAGFNYLVTEPGHPLLPGKVRDAFNYGVYSARFGNIYTSRQLEQLFRRAYGTLVPADQAWETPTGRLVDPFRPTVQPGGFHTREELDADRAQHLAAVRRAFETLDVFIFTLGLTECWHAVPDGLVFPLVPGVAGGRFDPERYAFTNLGVDEVVQDMTSFVRALRSVNPRATVILTVSPVPLIATAEDRHVMVSTTYSKAVLRVASEILATTLSDVYYFPSYEIVTGTFSRGRYYSDDLRSVTEAGVEHVMSLFFRHATTAGGFLAQTRATEPDGGIARPLGPVAQALEVLCDEELLTLEPSAPGRPA